MARYEPTLGNLTNTIINPNGVAAFYGLPNTFHYLAIGSDITPLGLCDLWLFPRVASFLSNPGLCSVTPSVFVFGQHSQAADAKRSLTWLVRTDCTKHYTVETHESVFCFYSVVCLVFFVVRPLGFCMFSLCLFNDHFYIGFGHPR